MEEESYLIWTSDYLFIAGDRKPNFFCTRAAWQHSQTKEDGMVSTCTSNPTLSLIKEFENLVRNVFVGTDRALQLQGLPFTQCYSV
ncbi:MAG: hypothetical protein HC852_23625 [Acaryochloridaceae cyanobacterium RU_4_10]|nr:hypothetical protein [Acaryochloridaceae cyanobacterium RU_4_10]